MTTNVNIRGLVLEILVEVMEHDAYSHQTIRAVLDKYQYLTKQERAFLTRVAEGAIERCIELDFIINAFSKVKVKKMKPVIRNILRMGVYQLKYMDAVPDAATCNEAVKLANKKGFSNLRGFVNGVLRNISRNLDTIPYPDEQKEPIKAVSVRYSVPEWIVELWKDAYGIEQTKQICEALLSDTPTSIRINQSAISKEELIEKLEAQHITVTENKQLSYALYISGYDAIGRIPEFTQGLFYVQDVSSMMVGETLQPQKGDTIMDVCAAPGGKSLHVSDMLEGTGRILARDVSDTKVALIEENIRRAKAENITAQVYDATVLDTDAIETADAVIADLPCSGLGIMGKKTDIKYKISREKCEELQVLQAQMLDVVCQYVKPDGKLLYSTCTVQRGENEEQVSAFLARHPEFTLTSMQQILPEIGKNDGFFLALMKKV